jgi:hypothetical protein
MESVSLSGIAVVLRFLEELRLCDALFSLSFVQS